MCVLLWIWRGDWIILPVLLVLASGIAHALWNLLAKRSDDKALFLLCIFVPTTALLLPRLLEELTRPGVPPQSYWLLLLSTVVQGFYAFFLSKSLTHGDISQVYPMMRGIGTMLLPLMSVLLLNERLTAWGWAGLTLIASGFLAMSGLAFARRRSPIAPKVIAYTLAVGLCTMGYVLVDKVNLGQFSPLALLAASNIGFMAGLVPFVPFRRIRWKTVMKEHGVTLAIGSILSPGSYLLFLFAMSLSPLTYVAPLREIGTVFGTLFGIYLLREPKEAARIVSACMIFSGIVLIGGWGM